MFKFLLAFAIFASATAHAATKLECKGTVIDNNSLAVTTTIQFLSPTQASLIAILTADGKEVNKFFTGEPLNVSVLGSVYTIVGKAISQHTPEPGKMTVTDVSFHFDAATMTSDMGNREDKCNWAN